MPHYLNSVTLVADDIEAARAQWARFGFTLLPGGVIGLGAARIVLRDVDQAGPTFGASSLVTTQHPDAPDAAAPPHPNGVKALAAVVSQHENPADHAETLGRVAGQREMRATSAGLEMKFANARLEALTPAAFGQRYAETGGAASRALVFATPDLARTRAFLQSAGVGFDEKFGRLVLDERAAGHVLAFEAQ
jgi:hypothetical protein